MRLRGLVIALCAILFVVAAEPRMPDSVDDLLRRGQRAFEANDLPTAWQCYTTAEERSRDPSLVAFNEAHILFQWNRFQEAEQAFLRVLDDSDSPPQRHAQARYNCAVCALKLGGLHAYRRAIDQLEHCLSRTDIPAELRTDAALNLELAKLLWLQARERERQAPSPNEPPQPAPMEPPLKDASIPNEDTTPTTSAGTNAKAQAKATSRPVASGTPQPTEQTQGGRGQLPVSASGETLADLPPERIGEYLQQLSLRLARERKASAALTAPPPRPNVKDW